LEVDDIGNENRPVEYINKPILQEGEIFILPANLWP